MTTGFRPASYQNLQLNAGLFLKNFNPDGAADAASLKALLAQAVSSGTGVIGATRGGGTFRCTPDIRRIEADGLRAPVKGLTVNDLWTVKLTGTMLEMTPENFASALLCADVTTTGSVTCVKVRNRIEDADYIPRLCWVGDTSRGFVLIELTQALNLSGANFTFTDKGEGTLPFEFQAHLASGDDDGYAPFRILFFDGEGA